MITSILGQVTGQLERRFLLNAFFPTLLVSLLGAAVFTADRGGVDDAVQRWQDETTAVRWLIVIGWIAAVLVGANLVANGTLWIIRVFEGYAGPFKVFSRWGRKHQLGRACSAPEDVLQVRFPVHKPVLALAWDDLAPTSLGNVLKSAETYSEGRYGVQAVRVWPRLYHLLPEELKTALAEARASMEFLLVVAFFASVFVPVATIYLIAVEAPIEWTLVALLGGSLVGFVAYRGAHAPAEIYGDHVRAAFDLHRLELLEAVGAPLPATNEEERRTWPAVIRLLDRGAPPQWRYVTSE